MNVISAYYLAGKILENKSENDALRLAEKTARVARQLMNKNYSILLENLSLALNRDFNDSEITEIADRNFSNFAYNLAEFLRHKGDDKEISHPLIEGDIEAVKKLLDKGDSVIAVSGHLGNWELLGSFGAVLGYPLYAVAARHKFRGDTRFFEKKREERGVKSVCPENIYPFLKNKAGEGGYIFAVMADRPIFGSPVHADMFGKKAVLSGSCFKLAQRFFKHAVFPFALKVGNGKYIVNINGPYEINVKKNAEEAQKELIKKYAEIYQNYAGKYPEQWHCYKRFFA